MKYKYAVGDKVVIRKDPSLGEFSGTEVTINDQQVSVGSPCYLVTTNDEAAASDVLWEGHISGATSGTTLPALLEEMTQPQITRAGVGTVVSDEYGHLWVKVAGGKWVGGTKDELQILTSRGLWEKFMSLELRKEGM